MTADVVVGPSHQERNIANVRRGGEIENSERAHSRGGKLFAHVGQPFVVVPRVRMRGAEDPPSPPDHTSCMIVSASSTSSPVC